MRYFRGGTLDTTLQTRQPVAESLMLVAEVADALEVAHRHGVVHRELTAKSILLDADGVGYLSDFGLAFEPDEAHDAADDIRAMGFVLGDLLRRRTRSIAAARRPTWYDASGPTFRPTCSM